jgi:hypothetical protein
MMATDPPASDLGAIRERLDQQVRYGAKPSHCDGADIRALLTAYDAQAARLAAMEAERRIVHLWSDNHGSAYVQLAGVVAVEAEGQRIGPFSYIVYGMGARVCVCGTPEEIAAQLWPPAVAAGAAGAGEATDEQ